MIVGKQWREWPMSGWRIASSKAEPHPTTANYYEKSHSISPSARRRSTAFTCGVTSVSCSLSPVSWKKSFARSNHPTTSTSPRRQLLRMDSLAVRQDRSRRSKKYHVLQFGSPTFNKHSLLFPPSPPGRRQHAKHSRINPPR